MNRSVFLSYRRADTSGHAGRICDDIDRHFGASLVFRDIESIGVGQDFVKALEAAIAQARVVLVLIGDTWLSSKASDGSRRLDNPDDTVRREVAMALEDRTLTVVPVLLEGAAMPTESQLPADLVQLARLQAIELSDARWQFDVARLMRVIEAAGVRSPSASRLPRWVLPIGGLMIAGMLALGWWCWQNSTASVDQFTGLWYLPNGSYWTVTEREDKLWVEETHHESKQVWKRGPGTIDGKALAVELSLVFDREEFQYLYRLRLSDDRQSLVGSIKRSDLEREWSVALTRRGP